MEFPAPDELLLKLAKPGRVPNSTEDEHIHRLAAMCWTYFQKRFEELLHSHSERPIAVTYQSDCTPSSTQETIVCRVHDERVVRPGALSSEY